MIPGSVDSEPSQPHVAQDIDNAAEVTAYNDPPPAHLDMFGSSLLGLVSFNHVLHDRARLKVAKMDTIVPTSALRFAAVPLSVYQH